LANPLVSICVPTRNRAASLRRSIESIRAQDYSPIEILISDNCSEDETEQVCRELMRADARIRYIRNTRNIGLHRNHNFCFDESRGDFVCIFHDHDDRVATIISRYVAFMEQHPHVGVVCSNWELIDDDGRCIGVREHHVPPVTPGLEYIGRTIRSGRSSVGIPGAMARTAAMAHARFGNDAPIGFGDFALWSRVAEAWDVGHIPERLWSWRQNRESHSARTIESIAYDYQKNLSDYCDEHLSRWPEHAALVEEWRASIRRYLFWALAYEVALHFRPRSGRTPARGDRSLFEIMDYSLTRAQFQHAVAQMRGYRSSAIEYATFAAISTSIRLRLTTPLGWATQHQAAVRALLGLK
jgi:glycosyltransferase involved in cell wall biosynthesis